MNILIGSRHHIGRIDCLPIPIEHRIAFLALFFFHNRATSSRSLLASSSIYESIDCPGILHLVALIPAAHHWTSTFLHHMLLYAMIRRDLCVGFSPRSLPTPHRLWFCCVLLPARNS